MRFPYRRRQCARISCEWCSGCSRHPGPACVSSLAALQRGYLVTFGDLSRLFPINWVFQRGSTDNSGQFKWYDNVISIHYITLSLKIWTILVYLEFSSLPLWSLELHGCVHGPKDVVNLCTESRKAMPRPASTLILYPVRGLSWIRGAIGVCSRYCGSFAASRFRGFLLLRGWHRK